LLAVFLVFGGSATMFFWIKWIGKLLITEKRELSKEQGISMSIWIPLVLLAVGTVVTCATFPLVSHAMVLPYIATYYGNNVRDVISEGNMKIMLIMLGMLALFPFSFINYRGKAKVVDPYLAGANNPSDSTQYFGSAGKTYSLSMNNYYMENLFGEEKLFNPGVFIGLTLLILMFGVCFL
jgi:ech hydrogenase subunit A